MRVHARWADTWDRCGSCGFEQPSYNSCRNRHCPKCQALAQQRWLEARRASTLPTHHLHVVFTLPSELRPLALTHRAHVFDALFRCASRTEALRIVRDHYTDFGPTLAHEKLTEVHGLRLSDEWFEERAERCTLLVNWDATGLELFAAVSGEPEASRISAADRL